MIVSDSRWQYAEKKEVDSLSVKAWTSSVNERSNIGIGIQDSKGRRPGLYDSSVVVGGMKKI